MKDSDRLETKLRKYYGVPPYHGGSNYVKFDNYYGAEIARTHAKEDIERVKKRLRKMYPEFM